MKLCEVTKHENKQNKDINVVSNIDAGHISSRSETRL